MYKLVSDSSCDMLTMGNVPFVSVPLTISTDERTYVDDATLDAKEMMDYLASYHGRSYTACPSIDAWVQAFEGADEIYVLCLTSGLSGTYNSAMTAREIFLQDHPEVQIHVFDTLSAGPQLPLLMEHIIFLKEKGYSFDEVCEKAQDYLSHSKLIFSFPSLHNFAQNGRVSKVVAAATGILGIRLIGTADKEGKVEVITKARGDKKGAIAMLKALEQYQFTGQKMNLAHANNPEYAEYLKKLILEKYPSAQINVYEARGICSYYGEEKAIFFGIETKEAQL